MQPVCLFFELFNEKIKTTKKASGVDLYLIHMNASNYKMVVALGDDYEKWDGNRVLPPSSIYSHEKVLLRPTHTITKEQKMNILHTVMEKIMTPVTNVVMEGHTIELSNEERVMLHYTPGNYCAEMVEQNDVVRIKHEHNE